MLDISILMSIKQYEFNIISVIWNQAISFSGFILRTINGPSEPSKAKTASRLATWTFVPSGVAASGPQNFNLLLSRNNAIKAIRVQRLSFNLSTKPTVKMLSMIGNINTHNCVNKSFAAAGQLYDVSTQPIQHKVLVRCRLINEH